MPSLAAPGVASRIALPAPLALDSIELVEVSLPLTEPFETSFGRTEMRRICLVAISSGPHTGWGEIVAAEDPLYSYETVDTAWHIVRTFFAPALLQGEVSGLDDVVARLSAFKGHPMARAGLELAFADLCARVRGVTLSSLLGGTRERVAVGVSLGIQARLDALLERVDRHLALGYQRIKLKIKPGWDIDVVRAVRERHPKILLSVDANAAYRLADAEHLVQLDQFGLLMIEQPLDHDDLEDHARLQALLQTPVCLDESITSARIAKRAIEGGSCRMVNMKVGRVGGYSQALEIHDLCVQRGIPLWCGGMLESGVGRAHNIALASLPGFTLPGDISASRRYFARDIIDPGVEVAQDGTVAVPSGPGFGFTLDLPFVEQHVATRERIVRP
jgi:O-succinylbenzoate synthase